VIAWLARATPSALVFLIVEPLALAVCAGLPGLSRALAANLEPVLGPAGALGRARRAHATWRCFAWCLAERYERFVPGRRFDASFEGLEHWTSAVSAGGGVVLVTAHIGGWELGSLLPTAREARTVHVVREPEADERAQRVQEELLASDPAGYVTHFARDDAALALELFAALRRGEVVALQGDRPRVGGAVHAAMLFGRPFRLPVGTAALARASGAAIVPVFTLREGRRRYRVVCGPPIRVERAPERATARALDDFARELERAIARAPYQWFCFAPLWSDSRAGGVGVGSQASA
jgi:KDO2-lipid IV(A) lauroyltransferase